MRRLQLLTLSLATLLAPVAAHAQAGDATEQQSIDHYKKGVTSYDLGKFDEAIEEFQKAYELKPTPAYLYNIAQAYRQKGDAAKAVFFYKRYLQKSPDAANRATVEKRISELEELAKKQEDAKAKPPNALEGEKQDTPRPAEVARAEPPPVEPPPAPSPEATVTASSSARGASVVRLALEAGPAFTSLGSGPSVPAQVSLRIGAAYTLHLGELDLDLGLAATLAPMPYETLNRMQSGTSLMIGGLANVAARYPIAGRLGVRGEVGGGLLVMTGLKAGNPFTDGGAKTSGPLSMPHLRAAVGADYELGGGLVVTVTPAFSYTKAGKELDDRIDAITRFDVLVGLAYDL